ncbi:transporter substrate-binding domain-containing protein [Brevibacillus ginsengisoli]|uniref:transporter substrate-binding domain-containing protein n=1 Tax=Brevibacillus ginsengisoli TaxID=363854 RepID=UPI003CFA9DAE
MKKMKSFVTLALTSVLAVSVLAGCGTASQNKDQAGQGQASAPAQKIVMATSADYPPYEFHDTSSGNDEIKGFDVDIANYIAKETGYQLEVKDSDFNGLIPALQAKRVDFVMAGMTPTDERKKNVDFSEIYYEAKNSIVAPKGSNLKTPESLAGKKVGVQLGSIQEGDAKEMAKKVQGMQIVPLNKIGDIVQELKSHRIDAAIIEDTVAKGYSTSNPDIEFNTLPSAGGNGSAVAFPKGSTHVEEFNKAIKKLKDSGELDKLIKKWFEKQ